MLKCEYFLTPSVQDVSGIRLKTNMGVLKNSVGGAGDVEYLMTLFRKHFNQ